MATPASTYTTALALQDAGVVTSSLPAGWLNQRIRAASASIDRVLGQRFIAFAETVRLSGDEGPMLRRADFLPILSVSSVTVLGDSTTRRGRPYRMTADYMDLGIDPTDDIGSTVLASATGSTSDISSTDYALRPEGLPRKIISTRGCFPSGAGNVEVAGVFGWVEPASIKAFSATIATSPLTAASTSLVLSTVDGLEVRDVLIVGGEHALMVSAINTTSKTVTIDAQTSVLSKTYPVGTAVAAYGAPPYGIENAVHILVQRACARREFFARGSAIDPTQIRRERTDRYEWEAFSGTSGSGSVPGGFLGIPDVDEILANYVAPTDVETG